MSKFTRCTIWMVTIIVSLGVATQQAVSDHHEVDKAGKPIKALPRQLQVQQVNQGNVVIKKPPVKYYNDSSGSRTESTYYQDTKGLTTRPRQPNLGYSVPREPGLETPEDIELTPKPGIPLTPTPGIPPSINDGGTDDGGSSGGGGGGGGGSGGGGGGGGAPGDEPGEGPPGGHGGGHGYAPKDKDCDDCPERREENVRAKEYRQGSADRAKSLMVEEQLSVLSVQKEEKQPMDIGGLGELIRERREKEAEMDKELEAESEKYR